MPGHHGVELVRPVVQREAVALEAAAQAAHHRCPLHDGDRPAAAREVVAGGEAGHSPAEDDDGAAAHADFLRDDHRLPDPVGEGQPVETQRADGPAHAVRPAGRGRARRAWPRSRARGSARASGSRGPGSPSARSSSVIVVGREVVEVDGEQERPLARPRSRAARLALSGHDITSTPSGVSSSWARAQHRLGIGRVLDDVPQGQEVHRAGRDRHVEDGARVEVEAVALAREARTSRCWARTRAARSRAPWPWPGTTRRPRPRRGRACPAAARPSRACRGSRGTSARGRRPGRRSSRPCRRGSPRGSGPSAGAAARSAGRTTVQRTIWSCSGSSPEERNTVCRSMGRAGSRRGGHDDRVGVRPAHRAGRPLRAGRPRDGAGHGRGARSSRAPLQRRHLAEARAHGVEQDADEHERRRRPARARPSRPRAPACRREAGGRPGAPPRRRRRRRGGPTAIELKK